MGKYNQDTRLVKEILDYLCKKESEYRKTNWDIAEIYHDIIYNVVDMRDGNRKKV